MTRIKRLVPKRRFKKFKNVDEWEQYDFKQLYEVSSGYAFNYQDYCDHGISLINGASIEHGKINKSNMNYLPEDFLSQYSNFVVKENDIVLGLNRPIINGNLKISKIPIELNNSLLYQRAGKINYMTEMDNDFSFVLLSQEILKYTLREAVGSDQPFISTSKLSNWKIIIPKGKKEQEKIGSFFKNIDEMIQLQQSKVNKVKDIKSAYLSEMFPKEGEKYPKKRFEGFTEPWTAKKLGSLLDYEQPTNYLVKSDSYDDSYLTPVLTAGKSFLLGYTNETEGIYKADNNNGVIIFDDFTTSSHFVDFDFKVKSSAMKFLRTNQSNFNLYFLYNLLTSINYSPESHERHWISIFSEFEVLVPTKKEQEKIAQLFKNLDNQISIEEKKLAKLEKLKQAYLNDMFV